MIALTCDPESTEATFVQPFLQSRGKYGISFFHIGTTVEASGMKRSLVISSLTSHSSICQVVILGGKMLSSPFSLAFMFVSCHWISD